MVNLKIMLNGFVLSACFAMPAIAHDSVSLNIRSGNVHYVSPVVTHYPNTVIYGRTPTVIYQTPAPVIQFFPVVGGGNFQSNRFCNDRQSQPTVWGNNRYQNNRYQHDRRIQRIEMGQYNGQFRTR
jgi:hypothetical protein